MRITYIYFSTFLALNTIVETSNFLTETGTLRYPLLSALFCLKLSNLMKFLTTGSFYPYFVVRHLCKSYETVVKDENEGGPNSFEGNTSRS
jgi:hypothetical protein